uniref:Cell division cycle protein 16 n=1 Tax=Meloidogyne incognita TaxID=6306 RepID=A0A914LW52_MELIC
MKSKFNILQDLEPEEEDEAMEGGSNISNNLLNIEEIEQLVEQHLRSDDCHTAAFWAEKLLAISRRQGDRSLSERLPQIANYLIVLTAARAWQTIVTLVERHDLFSKHLVFAFFNVNALFNKEMFSEIIALPIGHLCHWEGVPFITHDTATYIFAHNDISRNPEICAKLDDLVKTHKYDARLLFLLAKTYLMVQNRPAASSCLRHCLLANPYCSEALHLAIDSRLLKACELQEIVGSSSAAVNSSGSKIICHLLEIYDINREASSFSANSLRLGSLLSDDLSFQSANSFRLYSQGCVREAYNITSTIMHEFGYYSKCFLVHIGCLVHLSKTSELYQLGHSMVKLQPEREITWYTVGCYYYATGQYTTAKKFLNKCTTMNSGFGEGWIAYGHTLFYIDEHEQAMNCYLRASRILEGHFEPLLYIAVEYCFGNNFKLANDFLHDAEMVAGSNAIVLHEQGTAAFVEHNFKKAEQIFMEALRLITNKNNVDSLQDLLDSEISDFWEPLFNNLGHTLRKLGKYSQAISVHRKSLVLGTSKVDAWACIGICYASMVSKLNETGGATPSYILSTSFSKYIDNSIEALNKALALKPGDDLLKTALEKVMQFAADQTLQEPFFLDTRDENLDTMFESSILKQQSGCHKRTRRLPAKGLDKLDPNTTCSNRMMEEDEDDCNDNAKIIGLPKGCSSPMAITSQQPGQQQRVIVTTATSATSIATSPIFSITNPTS